MKTTEFKFNFEDLPHCWSAQAIRKDDSWIGAVLQSKNPPRKKAGQPETNRRGRHGEMEAKLNAHLAASPHLTKASNLPTAKNFDEFKRRFICELQGRAIDVAGEGGPIYAASNYVEEFWTEGHIKRLAKVFIRPRKSSTVELKRFLAYHWETEKLYTLDRKTLAAGVNESLGTKFSEDAIWKTAYRLGLTSDRPPGPKPTF